MDQLSDFGFGNLTKIWVELKFIKLIFSFSPQFGNIFDDFSKFRRTYGKKILLNFRSAHLHNAASSELKIG